MLIMNQTADLLLTEGGVMLNASRTVPWRVVRSVAGPVGRNAVAQADATPAADIFAWPVSHGGVAGVSVADLMLFEGQGPPFKPVSSQTRQSRFTIPLSLVVNEYLYGKKVDNREIIIE